MPRLNTLWSLPYRVAATANRSLKRLFVPDRYARFVEHGHFYSPLPDSDSVTADAARIYREPTDIAASIDLNAAGQAAWLEAATPYIDEFDWGPTPQPGRRYHTAGSNIMFLTADAIILDAMLRTARPARVVEVGSGYSSALMLDVDERRLGGRTQFTFIEPHPARLHSLLRPADHGRCTLVPVPVQQAAASAFAALRANDLLFIDSSHVSKAGSDVNYLLFDVMPSLSPGVLVHIHDIAWPFEYPLSWVQQGRAWNECYLVRAFLQYNSAFEIVFFNQWAAAHLPAWRATPKLAAADTLGGSLWLRKRT